VEHIYKNITETFFSITCTSFKDVGKRCDSSHLKFYGPCVFIYFQYNNTTSISEIIKIFIEMKREMQAVNYYSN